MQITVHNHLTIQWKLVVQKQKRIANTHPQKQPCAQTHADASSVVDCAH